ncbi:BrnT family toxin [Xanthobacter autotrophicus]|uniref:BrnT family toxin n=1 Tax=Xanthobacter autotrophicus TaxID=280 RepID=UPI00372B5A6B
MLITWDEPKRLANLAKHGMDFAALNVEFFLSSLVVPAKRGRHMAIGRAENGTIVVVFATLGAEGISVISMRRAGAKERRLLDD